MNGELDDAAARRWLVSGLTLIRIGDSSLTGLSEHGDWVSELLSERGWIPPIGVIIDLGRMLGGATTANATPLPTAAPEVQAALRGYQDAVLGRLETSPLFEAMVDGFLSLSAEHQARALAIVAGRVLDRLGFAAGMRPRPALVRELQRTPIAELAELIASGAEFDPDLVAAYEGLATGARRGGPLVDPTDVFLIEQVAVLGDLGQRLAVEQMASVTTEILSRLPRRLKPQPRPPERDRVVTRLSQEDFYPTGGFASISTSGGIENLVISELVYMEDDADLDLFDLRYAERELLYYTRDDSLFRRGRRVVRVALLPDLARARVKDPEGTVQRSVALWGLIGAMVDRLVAWLEVDALEVHLSFVEPPGATPLSERALVAILLSAWIERGVVIIESRPSLEVVIEEARGDAGAGESTLVVATTDPTLVVAPSRGVATGSLHLDHARPRLRWSIGREPGAGGAKHWADRSVSGTDEIPVAAAWRAATLSLLSQLV